MSKENNNGGRQVRGKIGELFVELILNYFKCEKIKLNIWPFPAGMQNNLSERALIRKIMFSKEDMQPDKNILLQKQKEYNKLNFDIKNVDPINRNKKNQALIIHNKEKLIYPDARIIINGNSPWVEVKSVYSDTLMAFECSSSSKVSIEQFVVDTIIGRYSRYLKTCPYNNVSMVKELFPKWGDGSSPCTIGRSYVEGIIFLLSPKAESFVMYADITSIKTSYFIIIGPTVVSYLLKMYDPKDKIGVFEDYIKFLHKGTKFDEKACKKRLESLVNHYYSNQTSLISDEELYKENTR